MQPLPDEDLLDQGKRVRSQATHGRGNQPERHRQWMGEVSWDILAGQFFQSWDPARHVKSFSQCVFESWQPRWISIDWGFEHATVVLWWTRVRVKTDLDQKAERTVLLCYRQLVMRQMNEQLVAERIAAANHTGDKFDPIHHIYLSPDRFSKASQYR